ncbi:kelch repeat-containing protein [Flammeovirgaceae bacterium SG7u.111]|nr:kelch repeat-containing protein [Flammeovirgaceae bacterium SG7u.132]WPO38416.1 kelch repeat-containing protein [Flammeovirgaceae bacterium SG7u.111]
MNKNIKILFYALGVIFFSFTLSACEDEDEDELLGNWVEKSDFKGIRRSNTVSFVIGETAYVGTGYNGDEDEYYTDFYAYNVNTDFWESKSTMPGVGRSAAVAFAIDDKAYVGLGFDGDEEMGDFYMYDSSSDEWEQIADFGGTARKNAVAFALNGKGYVGTGDDGNNLNDFWEYDPSTDTWTEIPGIGKKKENALVFVIGEYAYVGTGTDNGTYEEDFWKFDPTLLPEYPWTRVADLDSEDEYDLTRENASAFSMNGLGYIMLGSGGTVSRSVWEYDPSADYWYEKTSFEGAARIDAAAFSINNRGFVTTGRTGSSYFDDMWEFKPFEEEDEED